MCVMESPVQKFGYLDVKQSAKVKGRKMKSWKRRWVVLTKMTDMSSDQIVAKIDLFENETIWLTNRSEKTTFFLDNVTSIQRTRSRTHPHAFEVVQTYPELVFSGNSEIDSFAWILTLQQIFTPHLVQARKDSYLITIQPNTDAKRWSLSGQYNLAVSPACISINDTKTGNSLVSWGLSTLMRFNVTKDTVTGASNVLIIECGKDGPTGLSKFGFISSEASDILKAIRQSICLALAQRQNARRVNVSPRDRSISESYSEKQFQTILDSSQFYMDIAGRDRSESESSGCTLTPVSPFPQTVGIDNPLVTSPEICLGLSSRRSNSELGSLNESDEHSCGSHQDNCQVGHRGLGGKKDTVHQHSRHSSLPGNVASKKEDPGYSVIKEVENAADGPGRLRRNTIATDDSIMDTTAPEEPPLRPPPRRKRSSAVNITPPTPIETSKKEGKDQSDINSSSAISSSLLSSSFDSAKLCAENFMNFQKSMSPMDGVLDCEMPKLSPSPGCLNRRRSSSTPDLAAFWKHQAGLENVYEELDSYRKEAPRKSPASPADNPPALPARPFNLIVPTFRNKNNQTVVRLKKSFFFNKSKMQRGKSMMAVGGNHGCFCNYPYISSRGNLLSSGNDVACGQCGGSIDRENNDEIHKKSNMDQTMNFYSGSNSSLNDMYASISEFKDKSSKRRRSSEIARPMFLSTVDSNKTFLEKDPAKFHSLQRRDPQKSRHFQDLMNGGSDEAIENFKQQGASRLSTGSRDDPLISFFLDDDSFKSNPMVTGRFSGNQHSLQPPVDDLLISPDSPKDFTNVEPFIEDIFMMEPDTPQNNNNVLRPKNLGLAANQSMNSSNNDSLLLSPSSRDSEVSSNPVTYTCLRDSGFGSHKTCMTNSFSIQEWSNIDPFEVISPMDSFNSPPNQCLTPSPPRSFHGVQKLPQNNHDSTASASESLYLSMQESKISDSATMKIAPKLDNNCANGKRISYPKKPSYTCIDTCSPLTPEEDAKRFNFNDENRPAVVNRQPSLLLDSEDIYVCPGGLE